MADLQALRGVPIAAIMVPKVSFAWRIRAILDMIGEIVDLPKIIALVESAEGIANAMEIAATKGLSALAFGSEDFALDLGVPPTADALDLPWRQLSLAAASQRLPCFGLPTSLANFADLVPFEQGARLGKAIGMSGALCIHPRQIVVANQVFGSTALERQRAQQIIAAGEARAEGMGVVSLNGCMIDSPVVARARRVAERRPSEEV